MAVLYRHIRLDTNKPFYIGIGKSDKRAFDGIHRSAMWKRVASKGYRVELLMEDITWEEACKKEIEFIELYGRKDLGLGTLVNLTDGGDSSIGYNHTANTKNLIREKLSGANNPNFGKKKVEHSKRMSGKGNPNYGKVGSLNPIYGKPGYWLGKEHTSRRIAVSYKGIDYASQSELAKHLGYTMGAVTRLKRLGKVKTTNKNINN